MSEWACARCGLPVIGFRRCSASPKGYVCYVGKKDDDALVMEAHANAQAGQ